MNSDTLLSLVFSTIGGAFGAYVAVRVRIATIEARQERDREHLSERIGVVAHSVDRAHRRIDSWMRPAPPPFDDTRP